MSFNILRDLRDEPAWAWPRRRGLVVEVIRDRQPDVIAFQEVAPDMRRDLMRELPEYHWAPRETDARHDRPLYVGDVAYRHEALELEAHELIVSEPGAAGDDGWPLSRWPAIYGGTRARLRAKHADGPALLLWSVHLPHQSAPLRQHYADRLLEAWRPCRADGTRFVVAGDFNDRAGSPMHQHLLTDTGLADAQVHRAERGPDWIVVGGDAEVTERAVVDLERGGVRASDHPALFAHLRWMEIGGARQPG
ncbi:MAG: endonuclease/exonuclease/phosphatase family protein, partial [Phycisphaeraceae bacterium]